MRSWKYCSGIIHCRASLLMFLTAPWSAAVVGLSVCTFRSPLASSSSCMSVSWKLITAPDALSVLMVLRSSSMVWTKSPKLYPKAGVAMVPKKLSSDQRPGEVLPESST